MVCAMYGSDPTGHTHGSASSHCYLVAPSRRPVRHTCLSVYQAVTQVTSMCEAQEACGQASPHTRTTSPSGRSFTKPSLMSSRSSRPFSASRASSPSCAHSPCNHACVSPRTRIFPLMRHVLANVIVLQYMKVLLGAGGRCSLPHAWHAQYMASVKLCGVCTFVRGCMQNSCA